MKTEKLKIGSIPAVVYGEASPEVWLFVHGKLGSKDEAGLFAETVGAQVIGVDLPGHGERPAEMSRFVPWDTVPELRQVMDYIKTRWSGVSLRANSIGAWFSLLAFADTPIKKCLFVSPLLSMQKLIEGMMLATGVTARELETRGEIETGFGETLSWKYYEYAKANPVTRWDHPTAILYAGGDSMTSRDTVDDFASRFGCGLEVMENGEHWFHTPEQLAVLAAWEKKEAVPALRGC